MSPLPALPCTVRAGGPRASGDEPTSPLDVVIGFEWSPRERG